MAVFTVMTGHFGLAFIPSDLGVSAFFVLSGFLITTLLLREWDGRMRVSLRDFYARRTLRIFPAYYVFVVFSLVADRILGTRWTPDFTFAGFSYLMNYYNAIHDHPHSALAHAWSLAVEEQFYLLWPVVFILLRRRGEPTLVRGLAVIIAAVVAWRSYLYIGRDIGSAWVYNAFDCRFDNLAIGCLLAALCRRDRFIDGAAAIARSQWLPILTIAAIWYSRTQVSGDYHYTLGFTVDAILVAVLMAQLMQLHRATLWRWLEHPVAKFLGVISYPLYLYHIWGQGAGMRLATAPRSVQFAASVAATLAFACGSYFVVEKPFLALKRRFEPTVRPVQAGA